MTQSYTMFETASFAPRRITLRALPIDRARPMKRLMATVTAGVTALSMMIATAIPAHADRQSDNLAKALIAALAIGAIVHSIDKGKAKPAPAPTPIHNPPARKPVVPAVCAIEVNGSRHDSTFYPERCLRAEGFNYRLPRDCAIDIRTRGRVDRAYSERCLRKAGFRIGGNNRNDDWRRDDRRDYGHGRGNGRGRGGYGY